MRIAFYANGGSPIGVIPAHYWGKEGRTGLGGAEAALVWVAHHLALRGHEVEVYNNPTQEGYHGGVKYLALTDYDLSRAVDVLVVFRNAWPGVMRANAGLKVFWSCDQLTEGGPYDTHVFPWVDRIITISPYHKDYFVSRYGADPDSIWATDLGVNLQEYADDTIEKVPNRLIYCSQPERGLDILYYAFALIREQIPDVSLTITADRTLWGVNYTGDERFRAMWNLVAETGSVQYIGAIPHPDLARLQMEAEIMAYPGLYEELFCISAAEAQVAGAVPVTSSLGSLPTTIGRGINLETYPGAPKYVEEFAETVVDMLDGRDCLCKAQEEARKYGWERFDWRVIAANWEVKLEEWIDAIGG